MYFCIQLASLLHESFMHLVVVYMWLFRSISFITACSPEMEGIKLVLSIEDVPCQNLFWILYHFSLSSIISIFSLPSIGREKYNQQLSPQRKMEKEVIWRIAKYHNLVAGIEFFYDRVLALENGVGLSYSFIFGISNFKIVPKMGRIHSLLRPEIRICWEEKSKTEKQISCAPLTGII